jgi:dipeptidyl aminopeptidase/acylaminoacyl peptidase
VAYVAVREARHKNQECDLVVTDGRRYRTIASGQYVYAHEWRPDGSAIVYSTIASPCALVIHTLADGGEKTFEYSALDEKLHAHTAHNLAWRPDGKALACQITFVGGRLEDADGRIAKIAGDETVFVLTPEDGRLVALPAPGFIARLSWLPREAVERVGQHEVPNEQPR